ncbi:MAG TPA: hypothetical protein VFO31_07295 [Vicinamibacterales bacterium]|nr:hypothetical protein [Vicinamibacterales bacterium]
MTPTRFEIEALVMRIQDEFLRTSTVRMTLEQIARRFEASVSLCKAVLRVLVDARVLAETPGGVYERFFPQGAARASAA